MGGEMKKTFEGWFERLFKFLIPATCYSPEACRLSTIAAEGLNGRVRNGNGCFPLAIITGKKVLHRKGEADGSAGEPIRRKN